MRIIVTSLIIIFSLIGNAQNFQLAIDSANSNYTNGNYELAIEYYNQVIDAGYEAAEVYYNLGNAYFRSNKTTLAILNYERALKLNPDDEDILFNLQLSKQYVIDKIEVLPEFFLTKWYRSLLNIFNSNTWALISMFTFVMGLILLLLYFLVQQITIKKLGFWFGLVFLFFALVTFSFSNKLKQNILAHDEAIIITQAVTVKSSPDNSGTDLFVIHEGLKVSITDEIGEWREIKLTDGSKGWLLKTDLEKI